MKISIDELKLISDHIIKELNRERKEIELHGDYYWCVVGRERESMEKVPDQLGVGSLLDDWIELQKIKSTKFVTVVDIERFANILISIAEAITKPYRNKGEQQ